MSGGNVTRVSGPLPAASHAPSVPAFAAATARPFPEYLSQVERAFVEQELERVRCLALATSDGKLTTLYEYGSPEDEAIVLLPPYGMTFLLVARLARLLSSRHHVVVWESNGSPDTSVPVAESDFGLRSQAEQLARVVEARGLGAVHFVGWCQAAQISSYAAAHDLVTPKSMSWVAPAGFAYSVLPSEFDRCALPIYLDIERQGLAHAEKLRHILDKHALAPTTAAIIAEKLTMLHLAGASSTHVFSRYMKAYEENKPVAKVTLPGAVARVPTLVMHSRDDAFSHFSESIQIAKKHPSVRLQLLQDGGHLKIFNSPEVIAAHILEFTDSVEKATAAGGSEAAAPQLS
ncbi:MAG: alpha/beta fold hydrolase [Myxococcales bacterium]|nr:MAG: alpha/beta fold hydrolase [Myxococcales bacterium]